MKKKSLYISFICLFGLFFININGQLSTQKKEKEKYRKNTKSSSLEKNDKRKRCGFFDPRYSKKHREFTKSSSYPEKVTIDTYERIIKYNKKHLEDPLQGYNLTPAIVSQTYRIKTSQNAINNMSKKIEMYNALVNRYKKGRGGKIVTIYENEIKKMKNVIQSEKRKISRIKGGIMEACRDSLEIITYYDDLQPGNPLSNLKKSNKYYIKRTRNKYYPKRKQKESTYRRTGNDYFKKLRQLKRDYSRTRNDYFDQLRRRKSQAEKKKD